MTMQYAQPTSLAEALTVLTGGPDFTLIAGGTSAVSDIVGREPELLVDLRSVDELRHIRLSEASAEIGAASTHWQVGRSTDIASRYPALSRLALSIGDPAIRNHGTIGGSIAVNDPSSDYPAALLSLDATVVTTRRSVGIPDLLTGSFQTSLAGDEIIVKVSLPSVAAAGYAKLTSPASGYPICGVFVTVHLNGDIRVAVTACRRAGVFRHAGIEARFGEVGLDAALDDIGLDATDFLDSPDASRHYRGAMISVLARRAADIALSEIEARRIS